MKKKGVSLIEILISLAMSSILLTLIMTFFIINFKGYKSIKDSLELEFQAQYILSFMAGKIVNSDCISFAKPPGSQEYSMTALREAGIDYLIQEIRFSYGSNKNYKYVFIAKDRKISYGSNEAPVELGLYVDEVYISLFEDVSFQNARVIGIKIIMKKGDLSYEAFQAVCMRNKD